MSDGCESNEPRLSENVIRRNIKDAVFRKLFSHRSNVARLYTETHADEPVVGEGDVFLVSLERVVGKGVVGDLAFAVRGKVMCIVEAQSKDDPDIIFRCLVYLVHSLEKLQSMGDSWKKAVPKMDWNFVVIYPATGNHGPFGEVVKMNILHSSLTNRSEFRHVDLPEGSLVQEYIDFCNVVNYNISGNCRDIDAFKRILDECGRRGILTEFLEQHKGEIMDLYYQMTNVEYNHMLEVEEGIREGIRKGSLEKSLSIARALLARGDSVESVAEVTGLSVPEVSSLKSDIE
ncbi:MAG: hypothetical protein IJ856_01550 [Candidatus Methanomethylophilaceae archaeon]|nr:hypothetical protein [Candidatus Methanomethylophilaceae archaeon]